MLRRVAMMVTAMLFAVSCGGSKLAAPTDTTTSTTIPAVVSTTSAVAGTAAPAATTTSTIAATPEPTQATATSIDPPTTDGRPAPWHPVGSTHLDPVDAVREFLEFLEFRGDVSLVEFQGDEDSGEIMIDPSPPGESEWDLSTTVSVRRDDDGHWTVTGARSNAVIVDLPLPDSIVAPPLDVHFTHNLPSETARWDLWLDGAIEALAGERLIVDASGAFSVGDWDSTVDWPETGLGPATAVFRSVSGTSTQAVTTVRLVLADTDRPSEMPSPPTVIGPIGDQRRDILYQSGVRLSLYEPSDVCSGGGRPTIVTGGPQSNVFVEWFQQRGYLVADVAWRSPGYTGGLSTGTLKAFVYAANDLSVGVQWLRAHAEELCVDTERIAAIGYSFGAITSLSLAYTIGELVRGDDLAIDELDGSGTLGAQPPPPPAELASYSNEIAAVVSFAGFAVADTIEPGEPPALLIHGRDDNTIPFALAEQTCAAATQVGITCELIAHDSGHGMADDVAGALTLADEFLRREMGIATPVNP